jgi:chromosomal replication initiation ATPase DnaA
VTGGHRALWRELARHATPDRVAEIVAFPAAAVRREMIPEARPTPVPESGPRVRRANTNLARRVTTLEDILASEDGSSVKRRIATLEAQVKALVVRVEQLTEKKEVVRSRASIMVREVTRHHGVTMAQLQSRSRTPHIAAARSLLMRRLAAELNLSTGEIARLLKRDRATVYYHLSTQKDAA